MNGGGHVSQVYAIRQAISKALVAYYQKCKFFYIVIPFSLKLPKCSNNNGTLIFLPQDKFTTGKCEKKIEASQTVHENSIFCCVVSEY